MEISKRDSVISVEPHWNLKVELLAKSEHLLVISVEPHWNLKFTNIFDSLVKKEISVEPHWNLKLKERVTAARPADFSRTTLEFKVSSMLRCV